MKGKRSATLNAEKLIEGIMGYRVGLMAARKAKLCKRFTA
jgi:hypothetical protein